MYAVDQIIGQPQVNAFAANTPVVQTLPRQALLDEINIRVSGTLTNASYSVAPTKLVESYANIVGLVQVAATGKVSETFKSCGFDWFVRQMQLLEGTAPLINDVGTANQAYNFETSGKIYFRGAKWKTWKDTLLDSRLLSNLTLSLNWRDQTAMVTGGTGGTSTLSNVQATLLAREWFGVDPASTPAFGHLKESEILTAIAASQQGLKITTLPVGNLIRRMEFKGMVGSNSFSDPTDAIFDPTRVNNISIQDGAVYPVQANYLNLRARNKVFYGIESMPSGHALWEPSIHGTNAEQYDARRKNELDALLDVIFTGGSSNTLAIRTVEHVLPTRRP